MSDAIRLERVTVRTYRIRTSRFAKPASSIEPRRAQPRMNALSRFATGRQRGDGERGAIKAALGAEQVP